MATVTGPRAKRVSQLWALDDAYLNVTIICEYKILRFWDSDDFAGINFCDFTKTS